jgi:hypothetical protein
MVDDWYLQHRRETLSDCASVSDCHRLKPYLLLVYPKDTVQVSGMLRQLEIESLEMQLLVDLQFATD